MYLTIQNMCSSEDENSCYCGYIQVDNEKPMKIGIVRYFKFGAGYHTIKYMSEYPSDSPQYSDSVSQNFKETDWVNVQVYARPYSGIVGNPSITVNTDVPSEMINALDEQYKRTRQLVEESYQKAKDVIRNMRYKTSNKYSPEVKDEWERDAYAFLETVDKRCCLPLDELITWAEKWVSSSKNTPKTYDFGPTAEEEGKSTAIELVLCLLFGGLGVHKFYRKKIGMGIVYIITYGLFGIGVIVDTIVLISRLIKKK